MKALIDEATVKLVLEALENSIDLVSQEARNAEELYGKCPTRLARIQGLVAFEVAHEKAITALKKMAKQPAQQSCYCLNCEELSKQVTALKLCVEVERGFNAQEQPTRQKPFGYFKAEPFGWTDCAETDEGAVALYTTPQPAQPTWAGLTNKDVYECEPKTDWYDSVEFARAIEAKLREKNT